MSKKINIAIQVILVVAALAGSIFASFTPANSLLRWYNIDDAFYYYKVAQNVLAGHGFTFDGINLTNGFHPLWMVVCLGVFWLSRFNLLLPLRVLVLVSGLFNAATALVLYRWLSKHLHPEAAVVGAFIWALWPPIYNIVIVHGMESAISAFFLVLLFKTASDLFESSRSGRITPWQMAGAGLVGALTILSRLDNVFVVAMVGFFLLFKLKKIPTLLIYDMIVLALAVVVSWVLRLGVENIEINMYSIYPMLGVALLVKPIVYYFVGMYNNSNKYPVWNKLLRELSAAVINFLLMYLILSGLFQLGIMKMFSRSVTTFDAIISAFFVLCLRVVFWKSKEENGESPFHHFSNWLKRCWKEILLNGIGYAAPIALLIGGYMGYSKLVFGTFTPVSGQIKTWWSTLPNTVYSHPNTLISLMGLSPNGNYGPWWLLTSRINSAADFLMNLIGGKTDTSNSFVFIILFFVFIFITLAILKANNNRLARKIFDLVLPAVFLGCLFQIAYYTTVGYQHTRTWYWVGEMLVLVILGSTLLDGIFNWVDRFGKRLKLSPIIAGLILIVLCNLHIQLITSLAPMTVPPGQEVAYIAEVKEVESFTPEGSKIGMTGGGMVAYFISNRTVINLDGLINSAEYFHAMKTGTARDFLDAIPLNYVYAKEYVVEQSDPYSAILKNRLEKIGVIKGYEDFTLYRYFINQ